MGRTFSFLLFGTTVWFELNWGGDDCGALTWLALTCFFFLYLQDARKLNEWDGPGSLPMVLRGPKSPHLTTLLGASSSFGGHPNPKPVLRCYCSDVKTIYPETRKKMLGKKISLKMQCINNFEVHYEANLKRYFLLNVCSSVFQGFVENKSFWNRFTVCLAACRTFLLRNGYFGENWKFWTPLHAVSNARYMQKGCQFFFCTEYSHHQMKALD